MVGEDALKLVEEFGKLPSDDEPDATFSDILKLVVTYGVFGIIGCLAAVSLGGFVADIALNLMF